MKGAKRKIVVIVFALMTLLSGQAKTTYIPTYKSYIHIVNNGETVSVAGNLPELPLSDGDGMFRLMVDHEDVTYEKVKAIKRAKRAAGWASFSAVMSGVSTAFSNNSLQYMLRSTNNRLTSELADIYQANSNAEQILSIDLWIDNTTEGELMVNDMERGLTWYVLPGQSIKLKIHNPDAAQLRISDVKNETVKYAAVAVGSMLRKWEVDWEDDDLWAVIVYSGTGPNPNLDYIKFISKHDYSEFDMSMPDYAKFKKERKKKGNNQIG